jgi:integrase
LKAMVSASPDMMAGKRDRALILLGFAGALRRSELVALDLADIEESDAGLRLTIRQSKTDQDDEGATIAIAHGTIACPVRALRAWLDAAGIESGALFRAVNKAGAVASGRLTDRSVANIIKSMVGSIASTFSGHSLRSGFLTSAASNGASIFKMMDVSQHKSVDRYTARLRPRRRTVQGSRGRRAGDNFVPEAVGQGRPDFHILHFHPWIRQ